MIQTDGRVYEQRGVVYVKTSRPAVDNLSDDVIVVWQDSRNRTAEQNRKAWALMSEIAPAAIAEGMRKGLGRAREAAREILGECEGTLISLEAALALRLDPDCIPVKGEAYARKPGRLRIPQRVVAWLARRRVA